MKSVAYRKRKINPIMAGTEPEKRLRESLKELVLTNLTLGQMNAVRCLLASLNRILWVLDILLEGLH